MSREIGGRVIEELNGSGQKIAGYVYYPGGRLLAVQSSGVVYWRHVTPVGTGRYDSYSSTSFLNIVQLDPVGADVGLSEAPPPDTGGGDGDVGGNHLGGLMAALTSDIFNPAGGCVIDGHPSNCGLAMVLINVGSGNRTNFADMGLVSGQDIANSAMLSASPEAIFAPTGSVIAGITPG